MSEAVSQITAGRLLARNTLLNLLGHGAPIFAALLAIPLLIGGLGTERFGVLTVVWATIGYFSVLDLGIGRAVTQVVAERLGANDHGRIPVAAWTALALLTLLGTAGMFIVAALTPWMVRDALTIAPELQGEALAVFYLAAVSLPFVTSMAGLRGLLEAYQRFGLTTAVRIPMGVFNFLGPVLVLPFSSSLTPVVAVLVAGRVIGWGVHFWLCLWAVPSLRREIAVSAAEVGTLARFGGWITVGNLASTVMVYFDRFLIGALISMTAVAYYVTPNEMVTKLLFLPGALIGVLFPAFATTYVSDRKRMLLLLDRALRVMIVALFPVSLLIVLFASEALQVWLGSEFAQQSARVLQWLAVGVFINSVGQVASGMLQGARRPDLTGKLNLVEVPLYLAALAWLLNTYGIEGAAMAWVLRMVVDTIALFWLAERVVPSAGAVPRRVAALMVGACVLFVLALQPEGLVAKVVFALLVLPSLAWVAWSRVLSPEERSLLRRRTRKPAAVSLSEAR